MDDMKGEVKMNKLSRDEMEQVVGGFGFNPGGDVDYRLRKYFPEIQEEKKDEDRSGGATGGW